MKFQELGLDRPILAALSAQGYENATPIQEKAIPHILEGRDIIGLAQTGTGKTAAFTLPVLQRLNKDQTKTKERPVRVLILSPTRELAAQIRTSIAGYGAKLPIKSTGITGGVPIRRQIKALESGVDIIVATPGRLLDIVNQKKVRLNQVETLILDEADHMMDIGFLPDIRRIIALLPQQRQTMLFSATMPKKIRQLADDYLTDPIEVSVAPVAKTADKIEQSVMFVPQPVKFTVMCDIARNNDGKRIIVFTRTKRGADKVARRLSNEGIEAAAIHGNKSQGQRDRALAAFKDARCKVLIATDIAARGIDVPDVGLVVNFDLPNVPEVYVHRIGRTARAGLEGKAVSLCSNDEKSHLRSIERLIKLKIAIDQPPAHVASAVSHAEANQTETGEKPPARKKPPRRRPVKKFRADNAPRGEGPKKEIQDTKSHGGKKPAGANDGEFGKKKKRRRKKPKPNAAAGAPGPRSPRGSKRPNRRPDHRGRNKSSDAGQAKG